ncbi:MAG: RIP metalloprotease RseP [SAR324 cluster bacterium]|nr:RIP metalloprotease RseP [SAR324 cluster bacterium]
MITTITVILVLSFLIFIHELGHYLASKAVGVRVIEFSIGFPPKIISKIIGQTEYMLSLIPIGGYVRLHGQNIEDENSSESDNYASKSIWQRLLILLAGPLMNLLVAFAIMPFVYFVGYDVPAYMLTPPLISGVIAGSEADKLDIRKNDLIVAINGTPVKSWREAQLQLTRNQNEIINLKLKREMTVVERNLSANLLKNGAELGWQVNIAPVIGEVSPQSPAELAGLLPEDRILEIEGQSIDSWSDISPLLQKKADKEVHLRIQRKNNISDFRIIPAWNPKNSNWIIGIGSQRARVSESFIDAVFIGSQRVIAMALQTLEFLYQLISFQADTDSVGGPIMIVQMVGQAAKSSFSSLTSLVAFISLQFAIFNLLPIPALDGGHIFFLGLEKIKGSSLSKKFRLSAQKMGFTLLMFLIVYISVKDGLRIFGQ